MSATGSLETVAHNLRVALGLAIFVEFSFIAAGLAIAGAFNGGGPTTTPLGAKVYLVAGFVVTIGVIVRTWQMLKAAERGDRAALVPHEHRAWALVAVLFSAILPSIYLVQAATALPRE